MGFTKFDRLTRLIKILRITLVIFATFDSSKILELVDARDVFAILLVGSLYI